MISISFLGAAQTVTGSKYLLRVDRDMVLVDCGAFQGLKDLRLLNWDSPPFNAHALKWIILTHAHIDHIGFIPRLWKYGFRGKILCSEPTARLADILLLDAASLHEEDARFLNKTKATRHAPALPFFTVDDARAALRHFQPVKMEETVELTPSIHFRLRPVGHILGACTVQMTLGAGKGQRTVLFSGDIGRYTLPLLPDPEPPVETDYLVLESTYGDRLHSDEDPLDSLKNLVKQIVESQGILLIPAFAVGRSQLLVHLLNSLVEQRRIPPIPIHVDSPMAIDATEIFCDYPELHRANVADGGECIGLHARNVHYHRTRDESQSINTLKGPRIIISSSGMLSGGRILHHIAQRADDPENIIALAGFQAVGTRGRDLLDGKKTLKFHGRVHTIAAKVTSLNGLSGHADYREILRWLAPLSGAPRMTFITHGEPGPAAAMADRVRDAYGHRATIPELGDVHEL